MRGIHRYKKNRTHSASKAQLVVMLYQEAIGRLVKVEHLLGEGPQREWLGHVHHVRSIILELMSGLDHDAAPEFCAQILPLYRWALDELIAVGRDREPKHVIDVRNVFTTLLDGWQKAVRTPEAAKVGA